MTVKHHFTRATMAPLTLAVALSAETALLNDLSLLESYPTILEHQQHVFHGVLERRACEVSLLDDSFFQTALDDIKFEHDVFEDCESKAEVASQILENLENLVDLDELIKSGWCPP
ncbi:hypothetical protein HUJ04_004077 [Dendroctonus ponderosae]|nr:hypothetical protein HUJ04_004077 [Dendroctonus ponderosae]